MRFALLVLAAFACELQATTTTWTGSTMGTTWSATFVADRELKLTRDDLQAELDQVVREMSHWEPTSDLSRFNAAPADTWITFPDEAYAVITQALQLAERSDGAFDPTIGAVVNAWGFGATGQRRTPPSDEEIEDARRQAGWRQLALDAATHRLRQPGGLRLDLSSSAEGFAVDELARRLERAGVHDYLIDVGGELRAGGRKPDGRDWQVAIDAADGQGPEYGEPFALRDCALSTSGDSQHYFVDAGLRYSHLIDARTGRPVTHGLIAVSVLAPSTLEADQLSTLLGVLGPEAGRAYAKQHGIAARFVERRPGRAPKVRELGGFPRCSVARRFSQSASGTSAHRRRTPSPAPAPR
jgi:thiamine biosynthesis lipoprotein